MNKLKNWEISTEHKRRSVVLPLLMLVAFLSACNFMSHTHCDDRVLGQQRSPDGKIVAITYARSCANNTALYTWVGLENTSTSSLPSAEIEVVLTMKGTHEITVVWQSSESLEIQSPGFQDPKAVPTREGSWRTVTISYKN